MKLKVETLNIYMSKELENLSGTCNIQKTVETSNLGIYPKEKVKDGVYILTESGYCIEPRFWGLYAVNTPIGVAVIEGEHKIIVALRGSEEGLTLLEDTNNLVNVRQFDSIQKAKKDWDGRENTRNFLQGNSPAALFCAEYESRGIKKGSWWLPSVGELDLMYRNKPLIDACLTLSGGSILPGMWHWSSSEYSCSGAWVLYWYIGSMGYYNKTSNYRVRPVSAF